jgi:hypothetical protein
MGSVFYRGIDPTGMGYADLRYWNQWHEKIADTELKKAQG